MPPTNTVRGATRTRPKQPTRVWTISEDPVHGDGKGDKTPPGKAPGRNLGEEAREGGVIQGDGRNHPDLHSRLVGVFGNGLVANLPILLNR
jgi:hypothetical protein